MGDASEMSSVQSAWEDLVVENPNRHKMEVCLLTTLVLIVICIMGLIVFVFVNLQPADNVKFIPPAPKTKLCKSQNCDAHMYRVMGWVHWGHYPCKGVWEWACSRRAYESPEQFVTFSAAEAARDHAVEMFNMMISLDPPASAAKGIQQTVGMKYLGMFMDNCLKGYKRNPKNVKNITFKMDIKNLVYNGNKFPGLKGFHTGAYGDIGTKYIIYLADHFLFYPYHEMEARKPPPANALKIFFHPMKFLGRAEHYKSGQVGSKFKQEFGRAYQSLGSGDFLGNGDYGPDIYEAEKILYTKEHPPTKKDPKGVSYLYSVLPSSSEYPVSSLGQTPQYNVPTIVQTLFGVTGKVTLIKPTIQDASAAVGDLKQKGANLITFKFMFYLMPLWADDDSLAAAQAFGAKYVYNRDKKINPALHCARLAERFFLPAVMEVVMWNEALYGPILKDMKNATDKAFKGVGSTPFINRLLKETGIVPEANIVLLVNTMKALSDDTPSKYKFLVPDLGGKPRDFIKQMDNVAPPDPPDTVMKLVEAAGPFAHGRTKAGESIWHGNVFSADPQYDSVEDVIYVPHGLAMPPLYHRQDTMIAHGVPAYAWSLLSAALFRVFVLGFKDDNYAYTRYTGQRLSDNAQAWPNILKRIKCYGDKGFRDPLRGFVRRSALAFTYILYHSGFNKATGDGPTQYRLRGLPFISEEELFYLSAAQAFCEVVSKSEMADRGKEVKMMLDDPFSGDFFRLSLGCNRDREMSKEECKGMFNWRKTDESFDTRRTVKGPKK